MSSNFTSIYGIATAVPRWHASQEQVHRFMREVECASSPNGNTKRTLSLLEKLYAKSGIKKRHSVLSDFVQNDPEGFEFHPRNWALDPFPTTRQRMQRYERESIPLTLTACRDALREAEVAPEEVTHLVISTCTGFFAPGPDIMLARELGLPPTVSRLIIGFMGCYAGFSGLSTSDRIVRAEKDAVVLQVSVELCSLHYQKSGGADMHVANSLFADGCSAAVYAGGERNRKPLARIVATHSRIQPDSLEQMSWHIGDHGFEMRLDIGVPRTLRENVPGFFEELLRKGNAAPDEIGGWALHPGGRKIIEVIQEALRVDDDGAASALGVLSDYGNMSSASILFVLDRELRRAGGGGYVPALGFGPGITMEGALFVRGGQD